MNMLFSRHLSESHSPVFTFQFCLLRASHFAAAITSATKHLHSPLAILSLFPPLSLPLSVLTSAYRFCFRMSSPVLSVRD